MRGRHDRRPDTRTAPLFLTVYMEDKMTKQEAEEIVEDIVEAAYLNAREVDPEHAKKIQEAVDIIFS